MFMSILSALLQLFMPKETKPVQASPNTSPKDLPNAPESHIRRINAEGLSLIKSFEGCKLEAYRDVIGVLTISYGSTGPHVKEGMKVTQEEAEAMLIEDLDRFEVGVSDLIKPLNGSKDDRISDNAFSALVSFSFNVGLGNLKSSTLLKMVLSKADKEETSKQFLRWDKAGGKSFPGLARRREAERQLFLKV